MALRPQDRERGLEAVNQSRAQRRRAIVVGRVRVREVATRFWLLTFAGLIVFGVVYYRYAQNELIAQKNAVAARQRAVALAIGPEGPALRDKLEAWISELARGELAEHQVAPGASLESIARGPGIYVRLSLASAGSPEGIREGAMASLHDGFTACLFVGRAGDPKRGTACRETSECGPGELCNDFRACAPPDQPFNMKHVYEALKITDPAWSERLEAAPSDYAVRAVELGLEDAAKHHVPIFVELVRRSRYFTAVLDEAPEDVAAVDAGAPESERERLQASDHFVRVGIWDLEKSAPLLRGRFEAAGRFLSVGRRAVAGSRAEQRQANNCALAGAVREVLLEPSGAGAQPASVAAEPPQRVAEEGQP